MKGCLLTVAQKDELPLDSLQELDPIVSAKLGGDVKAAHVFSRWAALHHEVYHALTLVP